MLNKTNEQKNIICNLKTTKKGINLSLIFNKSLQNPITLKTYLKNSLKAATFVEKLNVKIMLSQNVSINLTDDVLDFDIIRSSIEFALNENSKLNYNLNCTKLQAINQTDDGIFVAYNRQGYFEKELIFKLIGSNSQVNAICKLKGTDKRFFKIKTIQDHQISNTKSNLLVKGAFCQKSKLLCDSLIKVNKDAQKVVAAQMNKNLLLGCHSEAISVPKLEVEADDVNCKHGSATSHLDKNQLFYLQSRGISHCDAKNILINAFLS